MPWKKYECPSCHQSKTARYFKRNIKGELSTECRDCTGDRTIKRQCIACRKVKSRGIYFKRFPDGDYSQNCCACLAVMRKEATAEAAKHYRTNPKAREKRRLRYLASKATKALKGPNNDHIP